MAGSRGTAYEQRGLIAFDLSGLSLEADVQSAEMELKVSNVISDTDTSYYVNAHRMLQDWGEGDGFSEPLSYGCDWIYAEDSTNTAWDTPGMNS